MLYKTHVIGGFAAGFLLTGNPACGAVSAAAALLPDIDDPHSFIGRKLFPVSWAANRGCGHRHAFHSLIAAVVFSAAALLAQILAHWPHWIAMSVFIGYVSHLVLDTLNPAGVPWLWPCPFRFRIPLVPTGGLLERLIVKPAIFIATVCLVGTHCINMGHLDMSRLLVSLPRGWWRWGRLSTFLKLLSGAGLK